MCIELLLQFSLLIVFVLKRCFGDVHSLVKAMQGALFVSYRHYFLVYLLSGQVRVKPATGTM